MKMVLIPVRNSRGLRRCQACEAALESKTGGKLILDMADLTSAVSSCLHNTHQTLLKRALHLSLASRLFLSMIGTCWPGGVLDIPKLVDFVEGYQSALTVLEYFRHLESVSSVVSEMLVQSFPDDGNSSIGQSDYSR